MHLFIYWRCFKGLSGVSKRTRLLLVLAFGPHDRIVSTLPSLHLSPQPNSVNRLSHFGFIPVRIERLHQAVPASVIAQSALGWKGWSTLSPGANTSRYQQTVLNVEIGLKMRMKGTQVSVVSLSQVKVYSIFTRFVIFLAKTPRGVQLSLHLLTRGKFSSPANRHMSRCLRLIRFLKALVNDPDGTSLSCRF